MLNKKYFFIAASLAVTTLLTQTSLAETVDMRRLLDSKENFLNKFVIDDEWALDINVNSRKDIDDVVEILNQYRDNLSPKEKESFDKNIGNDKLMIQNMKKGIRRSLKISPDRSTLMFDCNAACWANL